MTLKLINQGGYDSKLVELAAAYCQQQGLNLTMEFVDNQFWLHSDVPKERPIGIQLDQELGRHADYFRKSSLHKELLARAVGIKGAHRPHVLDLTGGLLGDSLLLLSIGCEVTCVERNPVIALLIESALKVASHPALSRFHFSYSDAAEVLGQSVPEVIFFDPMFEDANQKTSPRKEMRIFRSFVGEDQDAQKVWALARDKNAKRLVVKRPRLSHPLGQEPDVKYEGKSTRYDVYFSRNMALSDQIP